LPNDVRAYSFSPTQYVKEAVLNVENYLDKYNYKFSSKKVNIPIPADYHPELDSTPELNQKESKYYQSLIGILRWIVELGRLDINYETSIMSSHVMLPRTGHLLKVIQIFRYLKHHQNARLVFDPTYPTIDYSAFPRHDWQNFYEASEEEMPYNMPLPLGKEMIIVVYVDADLAGDRLSRKSRTKFIVFLNQTPIYWYSKRQGSIETSTFGSEFCAMRTCCDYIRGLRYKLCTFGIPILRPAFVYGDNEAVLKNTTIPESVLKKRSLSLAYHYVREGCARGEWLTSYVKSENNCADIQTKTVPSGHKRDGLISMVLFDT